MILRETDIYLFYRSWVRNTTSNNRCHRCALVGRPLQLDPDGNWQRLIWPALSGTVPRRKRSVWVWRVGLPPGARCRGAVDRMAALPERSARHAGDPRSAWVLRRRRGWADSGRISFLLPPSSPELGPRCRPCAICGGC